METMVGSVVRTGGSVHQPLKSGSLGPQLVHAAVLRKTSDSSKGDRAPAAAVETDLETSPTTVSRPQDAEHTKKDASQVQQPCSGGLLLFYIRGGGPSSPSPFCMRLTTAAEASQGGLTAATNLLHFCVSCPAPSFSAHRAPGPELSTGLNLEPGILLGSHFPGIPEARVRTLSQVGSRRERSC